MLLCSLLWQSAMLDLVDIFAPAPDVPSRANPWDSSGGQSAQAGPRRADPWDCLGKIHRVVLSAVVDDMT